MSNPHYGKLADVWKHGVLAEVLGREPAGRYAETHAGSAAYPLAHDPERDYGVYALLELAQHDPVLARSRYYALARRHARADPPEYPGSALLAMELLGERCALLLCDLDPASAASLRRRAAGLGLRQCEVAEADGLAQTWAWLGRADLAPAVVHIDPFDPWATGPGGQSALDLAAAVADRGAALAYWYGYNEPGEQAWAYRELAGRCAAGLWCGDLRVTGPGRQGGDLGQATTPGTGVGMVVANVTPATVSFCTELGRALARGYAGRALPGGPPGNLVFTIRAR